ncbi:uncharacterized protein V1510DRAFT_393177 [Dipodascopsis tothii]|uniref:uncharacterized protein n=1 Tax=Dipodascopsis tothii TaxID=44089 RepID=UPI0034CDEF89
MPRKTKPSAPPPPAWPALAPRDPWQPVALTTALERQIYVVDNFFSDRACADLVAFVDKNRAALGFQLTPGPKRGEAVRVNWRLSVQEDGVASACWALLQDAIRALAADEPEFAAQFDGAVGLFNNIRIYKYEPGQFFGRHYDDSVTAEYTDSAGRARRGRTGWTLLIYLTGGADVQGGETTFFDDAQRPIAVAPQRGAALLHKHGADCLLHEGSRVTAGEKWLFRSDVVFG